MFGLVLFLILAAIAYWYFTRNLNYWKKRGINGPRPLPIFGNLFDIILTSRNDLELQLYKKYGNFYGYFLGNSPVLVVGEPELIKNILVKDFNVFMQTRPFRVNTHPIMKQNITRLMGDDWKRVRSITSPTFTSAKMKMMYPLMDDCLQDFMVHLDGLAKTKSNTDIKDSYGNFTLDVIASTAFGTKLDHRDDSLFLKYGRALFRINPIKIFLMLLLPTSVVTTLGLNPTADRESQDFFVNVAQQIIKKRKESGQKSTDLLQLLLDADQSVPSQNDLSESHHVNEGKEESEAAEKVLNVELDSSNKKLTEDEVVAQAVTFLVAGFESTAKLLTCATYELALNPEVQEKLWVEVTNASLNSNGRIPYEVLCSLPFLDAVMSETLRRHVSPVKICRYAAHTYNCGKTTVYPGQQVDIPVFAIHHDEKYYKDPLTFDPERFMPQNRNNLVPYTYLPFGIGPRNCMGLRFALMEAKLAVAQMIRRYTFFRCNETDVPLIIDRKSMVGAPKRAVVGIAMRK